MVRQPPDQLFFTVVDDNYIIDTKSVENAAEL
jgi:hypothetical protein